MMDASLLPASIRDPSEEGLDALQHQGLLLKKLTLAGLARLMRANAEALLSEMTGAAFKHSSFQREATEH